MNNAPSRSWFLFLPAALVAAGLVLHVFNPGGLATRLQNIALGVLERSAPAGAHPGEAKVRYVDIDEASAATRGPWPWPRSDLARIVTLLGQSGAKAVILDVPLAGPDPLAAQRLLNSAPVGADTTYLAMALGGLPTTDAALAAAMDMLPVVTRFETTPIGAKATADPLPGPGVEGEAHLAHWLPTVNTVSAPVAALATLSAGVGGALNLDDAPVYRLPLVFQTPSGPRGTLLLEAARIALGAQTAALVPYAPNGSLERWLGRPGPATVDLAQTHLPVTRQGEILLSTAPGPRAIPAGDLIAKGTPDRETFAGAVVVVGASIIPHVVEPPSAAGDRRAPSSYLAQGLSQLLDGTTLVRPIWADAGEELFILVAGLALCMLLGYAPLTWALGTALLAIAGAGYVSWMGFMREGWFIDPLIPGVTLAASLCAGLFARVRQARTEEAEAQAAYKGAFSGYVAPAAGGRLALKPAGSANSGERRTLTVLACTIRDFEDILTRYHPNPAALTRLVAAYHDAMTEIILKNRGAIAYVRGASLLAYWNGAANDPEHASNACNCALRMIGALDRLNEDLQEDARNSTLAFEPVNISVGIETGDCILGPGVSGRPELLAVGETLALAEFLEHRADFYGTAVLVGEGTHDTAEKLFALLEVDYLKMPHRESPVHIYALMGNPLVRASPKFRAIESTHQEIFAAYRSQNWTLARALVSECRKLPAAATGLYDLYEQRIAHFEEAPPSYGWDGTHQIPVV